MKKYLDTLAENQPERSLEEYLGAFSESIKLIQHENPLDRIGNAVLLAAKTALRLKAVNPRLKEHEIALRLQTLARSIRLLDILKDVTPEERSMFKWSGNERKAQTRPQASKSSGPQTPSGSHARTTQRKRTAR
ncbi:MAG: hypothetical protein HGA76_06915 [Candidatus Firestonebacteria bacterium]|nr:hypothetical protein [Candidatus Firestonebacteria bacterium]